MPLNLRIIILNVYNAVNLSKFYAGPDQFPLNYFKSIDRAIFGSSEDEGYFFRLYQEKENAYILTPEDLFKYKFELVQGKLIKSGQYYIKCDKNTLIPISVDNEKATLSIEQNSQKIDSFKNLPLKRFHYFKFEDYTEVKIKSDSDFVVGKAIKLDQHLKHKHKLVLCIFVDGLADFMSGALSDYEDMMPYTARFFNSGVRFNNHFSNAEWTLPSVPSFFTGRHQQGHGFFHPKAHHVIGEDFLTLGEIFKQNDYLTLHVSGNWRMSPAYGYVKGFDRLIYKKEMEAGEVIHTFIEHMRAFKGRDNFAWLSLLDVHHILKVIPDVSNQIANSIGSHCVTPWYDPDNKKKSVFTSQDNNLTEIYANEIKRLDFYLNIIYQYIEENFKRDEVLVTLVSDHGHAFLTNDQHPLSVARTKIPWMIKGGGIPSADTGELTENTDVFQTLIKCCGLNFEDNSLDGNVPFILGGKSERQFVLSQSIYPGQTYKAVVRDKYFEYRFEALEPVSADGFISGDLLIKKIKRSDGIEQEIISNEIEKYKQVIDSKIQEWNSKKNGSGKN